ncbi:MAG: efflux RND transporter periplasmic adaptor subunit [Mucilaginibacter sp.]|uniref:efflux RND transporter periplasmic adaptor subunit n=1 Tax=Mucilaginibacter sp. TaxID=1882438 RepID=UPI003262D554
MKKIFILSAVVFLAACGGKKDPKTELADLKKQQADINAKITALQATVGADSVKSTDVSVAVLKAGTFTNYVQIQGKIDAQDNVMAFAQVPGTITAINVKPGDHVSKGQVLVQLDASVLKQNIAAAQTKADLSKVVYQRQKNLWDQKIGTEVAFLTAKATMEGDQKQVDVLRQQADQYRIISPITGTVDQMDLKLGQSISAANSIRIVNADNLKVKADVPESYGSQINTGDVVKVLVPDAPDSLNAKLSFAAKVIDPTSRSFAVEVKLPQRKGIRPNMTAILKIVNYQNSKAISIPVKAIQKSEAGDYVYVAVNGIAKRTNVKAGATYGGITEILSGLKEGDQLVTDGASDIEDGSKIKIVKSGN